MTKRWWQALEANDIAFLTGLACLSAGCGWVYAPAGLIAPGVVLLWVALKPVPGRK
jgi:DNA-binding transcriptional LysR family regulator